MTHTVVVGASLAGVRVVEALRNKGFEGRLTLIGDEDALPYDRPPLSKSVLTDTAPPVIPTFHDLDWYRANNVELRLGERALSLSCECREIKTVNGTVSFDQLVIATGARARNPFLDAPAGVHTLRTFDDSQALRADIASGGHVVIIGGGFIGLEVAASARSLGADVTVIEVAQIPLSRNLGVDVAPVIAQTAVDHGVRLICGRSVTELVGTPRIRQLVLDNGDRIDADTVVIGVGAVPNTEWLAGSGLTVSAAGVICDGFGRAGDEIWAAGDVSAWADTDGIPKRHEHWTSATEQAKVLAHNILEADEPRRTDAADYVWSDQFGRRINIVGDTTQHDGVRLISRNSESLAALYSRDGILVGACVIGQARLMVKCRTWIARGTATSEIPEWNTAAA
ncbi:MULTISPECIES: NAD(P)/FAD-dependent oxidoreductase [Rhodococcus erythropolis group]|jgi:3-phenylpropionate/trans-cinnamate dioxygenase ferredoxin reductase subunit|uniref:NAD(P)/FAD-dependent oxidoreductase n=1 Tax=Rhodococcus erythropolis group TaxID=2840174 RepID=UPI00061B8540|nr:MULTISPECIES: FAD-dependent oxidoreductase [Rhodococcus erythropolis group]AKE01400.1 pyridine nucleotide-disulfide oxidoreductase [Rhodococcus erythropolis]MCW0193224.1 FAD-dependent oxidoreductase [Rhodococcus sp. (in: high G+C Gram-positive bacteria)]